MIRNLFLLLVFSATFMSAEVWATVLPFNENFDSSDGGFTTTGSGSWKWGNPTSGPGAAHSGSKVWATNLLGDYGNNEDGVVTSPMYDLTGGAGKSIVVSWWQFLTTESGYDYGKVEVSNNGGGSWETIFGPRSGVVGSGWNQQTVLLDETYAVSEFQIRFTLTSDTTGGASGFYFDDLRIAAIALVDADATKPLQDFESGDGGFVVGGTASSWTHGTPTSGPGSAHSAANAWGTNLSGLYNPSESSSLTSPSYDLSGATGQVIVVSWWQFIETEKGYDTVAVEVSPDNGASWVRPVDALSGAISPEGWMRAQLILDDSYALNGFKLRFVLAADVSFQFAGVYIDDVSVRMSNDALPVLANFEKSTPKNVTVGFSPALFAANYTDPAGGGLSSIAITQLPTQGALLLAGQPVVLNDIIAVSELGGLSYVPGFDYVGNDTFGWSASNDFGRAAASVTIKVLLPSGPVVITTQPESVTVNPGEPVHFKVTATGAATLSYQWRRNFVDIVGAVTDALDILAAAETDEDTYDVVVTNGLGAVPSDSAQLSVNDPITFTTQPVATIVDEGADTSLSVVVQGTGPFDYQWEKDGNPIPNATAATLLILGAGAADSGSYRCVVSNEVGEVPSDVVVLTVKLVPVISTPPQSLGVLLNGRAIFTVAAEGGNLSYQWLRGDVELPGATESSLVLSKVLAASAGTYRVRISNEVGFVLSDPVELQIISWRDLWGYYQAALAHDNSADPSEQKYPGRITVRLSSSGVLSGKLEYEGRGYGFRGRFTPEMSFKRQIRRGALPPVTVQLQLDATRVLMLADVSHELPAGSFTSSAVVFATRYTNTHPAPQTGHYTLLMNPEAGAPTAPAVPGYGVVEVRKTGSARFVGRVADGTSVVCSAFVHADGSVALHSVVKYPFNSRGRVRYIAVGTVVGPMTLNPTGGVNAVLGEVEWRKRTTPANSVWPAGGSTLLGLEGSLYQVPTSGQPVIGLPAGSDSFSLDLTGPVPGGLISRILHITETNKFPFVVANPERLTLKLYRPTGWISGTYFDLASRKRCVLKGVALQAQGEIVGFFRLGADAGQFVVEPVIP
ncbi:MAG: immunoglobulin domain-containing protein [Verrucomicrobiaceae bacterium]|nr:immunoglobulin domain-containing protein [Verrucomicrobiaceae bacterium]